MYVVTSYLVTDSYQLNICFALCCANLWLAIAKIRASHSINTKDIWSNLMCMSAVFTSLLTFFHMCWEIMMKQHDDASNVDNYIHSYRLKRIKQAVKRAISAGTFEHAPHILLLMHAVKDEGATCRMMTVITCL